MGAVCSACTERSSELDSRPVVLKTKQGNIDGNNFSHHFAQCNPGRLDAFYDVDYKNMMGEGAFGKCFKCKSKKTQVERAVKSINLASLEKEGGLVAFNNEVEISKLMDHPNIIKLIETFKDKHQFFLVMEVLSGGELFDRIITVYEKGKFTEKKVAEYVGQILRGIGYMHKLNVAHRDLKPENFLLQNGSDDAEVKIIDFGISRQFTPGVPMTTQKGTPMYIAPEVLTGQYSEKCDVWSIGVITFILLTGFPPFAGGDDRETMQLVKKGKRAPYDKKNMPTNSAQNFVSKLLTMKVSDRSNASESLELPWLSSQEAEMFSVKKMDGKGKESLVKKLRKFNDSRKLKKVALTMIATHLHDKDIQELREQFKALDKDGDGSISLKELDVLLKSDKQFSSLSIDDFKQLDSDGSGEIDYTEFIAAALDKKHYTKEANAKIAFNQFDLDGDGKITQDELRQIMAGNSGATISEKRVAEMIADADKNGDGEIDFEEFMAMMLEDDPAHDHLGDAKS